MKKPALSPKPRRDFVVMDRLREQQTVEPADVMRTLKGHPVGNVVVLPDGESATGYAQIGGVLFAAIVRVARGQ